MLDEIIDYIKFLQLQVKVIAIHLSIFLNLSNTFSIHFAIRDIRPFSFIAYSTMGKTLKEKAFLQKLLEHMAYKFNS